MARQSQQRLRLITAGLFALLLSLASANAGVYKSINDRGKTRFTDQPQPGTEAVDLKPTNTIKPIPPSSQTSPITPQQTNSVYRSLEITSPRNGSHLHNGLVAFNVNMALSPQLVKGHKVQLVINGKIHSTGSSLSRQVANIERGSHSFSARVIDQKGEYLIYSATASVSAQRPSQLPKRR